MSEKISLKDRIQDAVDNTFSRGTVALIVWLGAASLVVILIAAALINLTQAYPEGEQPIGFLEAAWRSLMRTLDAGTMGGDEGWGFRLIMFGVTLGGVFIISTLIGVLTSGVEGKLEELRKGHALDLRDEGTEGHTQRVTRLTLKLAKEMSIGNESLTHIRLGAKLHDIGKMGIPDEILHKPDKLNAEE